MKFKIDKFGIELPNTGQGEGFVPPPAKSKQAEYVAPRPSKSWTPKERNRNQTKNHG